MDDLSKQLNGQFRMVNQLNLSVLADLGKHSVAQPRIFSQADKIAALSSDFLNAVSRIEALARPTPGTLDLISGMSKLTAPGPNVLDAITRMDTLVPLDSKMLEAVTRSQALYQSIEASHVRLAATIDWPKLLAATTRAQMAFTKAEPFLAFYASHSERLASVARAQIGAFADIQFASEAWVGVAALEAELENLVGDGPTGRALLIYRLIVWSLAISLFIKLVGDEYLRAGSEEALIWAATLGIWLERAWHFYLADSGKK
jgi:hypothetical protein